jgi:hypothetical protein
MNYNKAVIAYKDNIKFYQNIIKTLKATNIPIYIKKEINNEAHGWI